MITEMVKAINIVLLGLFLYLILYFAVSGEYLAMLVFVVIETIQCAILIGVYQESCEPTK